MLDVGVPAKKLGATLLLSNFYLTLLMVCPPGNNAKDRNFSYFSNFTVPPQNM